MIYPYAICEAATGTPPPSVRGLGRASLRALEREGIGAVYSRHRSLQPRPELDLVLRHERVVEAVMARGPVLPMRYGTRLEDEGQLARALDERHDELVHALDRVRGQFELGLRVILDRDRRTAPSRASGRDYLLARVGDHHLAAILRRELHAPLARLATASVLRPGAAALAILIAAYLVDARAVPEFRRRAAELAGRHDHTRVVVTGPWPPYSFAAGDVT